MPGRFKRIWIIFWRMVAYGLWGCISQGGERKHSGIRVHFHINFVNNWTCTKRRFKMRTWFAKWLQWKLTEIQTSRLQSLHKQPHTMMWQTMTHTITYPPKNHQKTTKKWYLVQTPKNRKNMFSTLRGSNISRFCIWCNISRPTKTFFLFQC